jgi:hypothetical protein
MNHSSDSIGGGVNKISDAKSEFVKAFASAAIFGATFY